MMDWKGVEGSCCGLF